MEIVVILHNIRSLHNVGSIFRTADAAGVKKIYLCGITPAPMDIFGKPRQQLTKVSLGAEKFVEWDALARSARAISKLLENLKKQGYKIFAIEQSKKSISYYKISRNKSKRNLATTSGSKQKGQKVVLIVGNEVKGLPVLILKKADKILEIPMRGRKESLNVGVAFGVVVFHLNLLK